MFGVPSASNIGASVIMLLRFILDFKRENLTVRLLSILSIATVAKRIAFKWVNGKNLQLD